MVPLLVAIFIEWNVGTKNSKSLFVLLDFIVPCCLRDALLINMRMFILSVPSAVLWPDSYVFHWAPKLSWDIEYLDLPSDCPWVCSYWFLELNLDHPWFLWLCLSSSDYPSLSLALPVQDPWYWLLLGPVCIHDNFPVRWPRLSLNRSTSFFGP